MSDCCFQEAASPTVVFAIVCNKSQSNKEQVSILTKQLQQVKKGCKTNPTVTEQSDIGRFACKSQAHHGIC
jgi:hypothetical protein